MQGYHMYCRFESRVQGIQHALQNSRHNYLTFLRIVYGNGALYLHFVRGQIEGDAPLHGLSVLEVPEEPERDVENGDDQHRNVQQPVPAGEGFGRPHLRRRQTALT